MHRRDLTWVQLNWSTYLGITGRRVLGVLYWTDDIDDSQGTGDPENTFIWCWASTDPFVDCALATTPLRRGMSAEQIAANADVAREAVWVLISGDG